MTWIFGLLIALFAVKLTWNMFVPFRVERAGRAAARSGRAPPESVFMGLIIELGLLAAATLAAPIRFRADHPATHTVGVLVTGIAAIAFSYFVAIFWGRYLRRKSAPCSKST